MYAYDRLYLDTARGTLGSMLDYAVNRLQMKLGEFYRLFLTTGIADRFGAGEAKLIAGVSGPELAVVVLEDAGLAAELYPSSVEQGKSPEYWTGWALAYYQWNRGISFSEIERFAACEEVRELYHPYHEMDIRQFVDRIDVLESESSDVTRLARLRKYAEYSQAQLARQSGVPVRTIQQYAQRQKDIIKAGTDQVLRLARALYCDPENLIENTGRNRDEDT